MTTCFNSVRQKLHRRSGTFDLLGFDFLIDDDFKVRLTHQLDKILQNTTSTISTMNQLELSVQNVTSTKPTSFPSAFHLPTPEGSSFLWGWGDKRPLQSRLAPSSWKPGTIASVLSRSKKFFPPFSGVATGSEYKSRASHQLPGAHESPARSGRRDAK